MPAKKKKKRTAGKPGSGPTWGSKEYARWTNKKAHEKRERYGGKGRTRGTMVTTNKSLAQSRAAKKRASKNK